MSSDAAHTRVRNTVWTPARDHVHGDWDRQNKRISERLCSMYFAPVMPSCLCMFRRLTEAIIDKGIQLKRHDQSMRTTDCILNIIADGCLTIFGVIRGIDLTRTNENPMMHLHRQNARHKLMAVTLRHFNMHKSRHAVLTVCDPIHRQAVNFVDELLTDDVLTSCIKHYIKRIQIFKQPHTGILDLT